MKTPKTHEVIEHMFETIEKEDLVKPLSDWETNFLSDIRKQFDNRGMLSDKQFEILERIYAEKTA